MITFFMIPCPLLSSRLTNTEIIYTAAIYSDKVILRKGELVIVFCNDIGIKKLPLSGCLSGLNY